MGLAQACLPRGSRRILTRSPEPRLFSPTVLNLGEKPGEQRVSHIHLQEPLAGGLEEPAGWQGERDPRFRCQGPGDLGIPGGRLRLTSGGVEVETSVRPTKPLTGPEEGCPSHGGSAWWPGLTSCLAGD